MPIPKTGIGHRHKTKRGRHTTAGIIGKQSYEATPEEALSAYYIVKRQICLTLYNNYALLARYRERPSPRNLRRLANGVIDAYSHLFPKISKLKDCKKIEADLKGIDEYLGGFKEGVDLDPAQWVKWFKATTQGIESMGVTAITKPTTREGSELTEGTLFDDIIPEE
jgi:hypothetical protein